MTGGIPMDIVTAKDIAKMIDHSLLNPVMTEKDITEGCEIALKYDVATVCVKQSFVDAAVRVLKGSEVLVTTVVGFPHGSSITETKVFEAECALRQGCKELDMVLDIGKLIGGDYDYVGSDVAAVAKTAHAAGAILKVILENAYLSEKQIVKASKLCENAGADFVKTSTGYAPGGATLPDLRLMRASVSEKVQIKAAGGVRTLDAALQVRAVGATRFGCTATAKIMEEAYEREAAGTLRLPDEVGDVLGELGRCY